MGDTGSDAKHTHSRPWPVLGVVVVLAVLVVAGAIVGLRLVFDDPAAAQTAAPSGTSSAAAPHDYWANGTKTVRYRGVEVDVPRELGVRTQHCGRTGLVESGVPPTAGVLMGDPYPWCGKAPDPVRIEAPVVQLVPTDTPAGRAAVAAATTTDAGYSRVFEEQKVLLTVTDAADRSFESRVVGSARTPGIGASGCAVRGPAVSFLSPTPARSPLVSGPVDGATLCVYAAVSDQASDRVLREHSTLDVLAASDLLARVRSAPAFHESFFLNLCLSTNGDPVGVIRFRSGTDEPRDVVVRAVTSGTCGEHFAERGGRAVLAVGFDDDAMLTVTPVTP